MPHLLRAAAFISLLMSMQPSVADTVYVSPAGSDGAAGSRTAPVRSISQALRRRPGVILLEPGIYRLAAPITITGVNSGLTIQAAPNAHPIVTSAQQLQLDWRQWHGGIYRAAVPASVHGIDTLWVNGRHEVLARYPNFDRDARYLNGTAADAISAARAARWSNARGAIVHAMQEGLWGDEWFEIIGKLPDGEPLLSAPWGNNRPSPPHPEYRYVEGVLEELDAPGEWYFDAADHFLYYYPHVGMDLATAEVEAAESPELFRIDGGAAGTVRDVTLRGLDFEHTARSFRDTREPLLRSDWEIARKGVVFLENTDGCRVERCRFEDVGSNGVFVSGRNRHAAITNCLFRSVGASGICFVGRPSAVRSPLFHYSDRLALSQVDPAPGPRTDAYPMECTAQDCLMLRTGRVELQSAGVEISMARRITVDACTIRDVPRAGINIGDGCWGGDLIENCDVSDTVLQSSDHGAFNSWGRDRYWGVDFGGKPMPPNMPEWDTIEPNILKHNRFQCAHGWDIDLDDGSSNTIIEDNLCMQGGLKLREGYSRVVRNNLILFNGLHLHVWFANSHDVIERNLVASEYAPIEMPAVWGASVNHNFLCLPGQPVRPAGKLQRVSHADAQSLEGDPGFVNGAAGDYRLIRNAPALATGFVPFPLFGFGVTDQGLQRLAASAAQDGAAPPADGSRPRAAQAFLGGRVENLAGMGEVSATGMYAETGVLVLAAPDGSELSELGVLPRDVILTWDETPTPDVGSLVKAARAELLPPQITVWRRQKRMPLP